MTNLEGRVLRRRKVIDPPEGVRSELWILSELARRLGSAGRFSTDAPTVFDELCRASEGGLADYSGLSYDALDDDSAPAYWPFPRGSSGTPRLFVDRFPHVDGRARLVAVKAYEPQMTAQKDGVVTLITGRLLEHYQSGAQTRRVRELLAAKPEARMQIHPATAELLGIDDGSRVEVSRGEAAVRCRAELSLEIRPDTVFLPFHFGGEQCANLLTEQVTDPISGMPEFKRTTVRVRSLEPAPVPEVVYV
jgi:assimilatory nitrate reductase catalytic subunit